MDLPMSEEHTYFPISVFNEWHERLTHLSPCSDLQLGNHTLAKHKYEDPNHIPLSHNVIHSFGRK